MQPAFLRVQRCHADGGTLNCCKLKRCFYGMCFVFKPSLRKFLTLFKALCVMFFMYSLCTFSEG